MDLVRRVEDAPRLIDVEIVWSNRYMCPTGYTFNDEGWVVTDIPFPKIGVSIFPHHLSKYSIMTLFAYNLLALVLLNPDVKIRDLATVLSGRVHAAIGHRMGSADIKEAITLVSNIDSIKDVTSIPEDIFRWDTIWYDRDTLPGGKRVIVQKLRDKYITAVRDVMEIRKKYKTKAVATEADVSLYAVRKYWDNNQLSTKHRTVAAIVEAKLKLEYDDKINNPTHKQLSDIAGVSINTLVAYKAKELTQSNLEDNDNDKNEDDDDT